MKPVKESYEVELSDVNCSPWNFCEVQNESIQQNNVFNGYQTTQLESCWKFKKKESSSLTACLLLSVEPETFGVETSDSANYKSTLKKQSTKMRQANAISTIVLGIEKINLDKEKSESNTNVKSNKLISEMFNYCQLVTKVSETDTEIPRSSSNFIDQLNCYDKWDFSNTCSESKKYVQTEDWKCKIEKDEQNTDSILQEVLFSWKNLRFKSQYFVVNLVSSIQLAKQNVTHQLYSRECARIVTFKNYPPDALKSGLLLAHSGFIYNGFHDKVKCVYCGVEKQDWELTDFIEDIHLSSCSIKNRANNRRSPVSTQYCEVIRSIQFAEKYIPGHATTSSLHSSRARYWQESSPPLESQSHETVLVTSASSFREPQRSTQEIISGITEQNLSLNTRTLPLSHASISSSHNPPQSFEQEIRSSISSSQAAEVILTPTSQSNVTTSTSSHPNSPLQSSTTSPEPRTRNSPTYEDLGILTERPKRTEYALKIKRLETFTNWPRDHHLSPEELSRAGFYYAGYGDCTRCFYCGGGLRNWEDDDDVWVEHARWFQRCAFVRQQMGQVFVNTVQTMNTEFEKITMEMVTTKLGVHFSTFHLDSLRAPLKRDPVVRAFVALGYLEKDIVEIAEAIKLEGNTVSADSIVEKIEREKISKTNSIQANITLPAVGSDEANELINQLKERNGQLRQQTVCKICMDGEVSVVFLPCGHLISCAECASAMRNCPLCREQVRGIVRAFMGD